MKKKMHAIVSVRLFQDTKCFGPGIAELLSRVDRMHSLRAAAMSMNMAYSKAWRIVRETEAALGFKLLHSATGGQHGGGAVLTDDAARLLEAYRAYAAAVTDASANLFEEVFLPILHKR